MDLSAIKTQLSNFATLEENIIKLFKGIPDLFVTLGGWFIDKDKNEKLDIVDQWDTTAKIFGDKK